MATRTANICEIFAGTPRVCRATPISAPRRYICKRHRSPSGCYLVSAMFGQWSAVFLPLPGRQRPQKLIAVLSADPIWTDIPPPFFALSRHHHRLNEFFARCARQRHIGRPGSCGVSALFGGTADCFESRRWKLSEQSQASQVCVRSKFSHIGVFCGTVCVGKAF